MYNANLPWYLGNPPGAMGTWWGGGIAFLAIWSVIWTGLALWHAARRENKGWFIVFLIVHTAGILELIYLIFVAKAFSHKTPKKRA